MKNHVTLAATWTDEDLGKIKEVRRQYSHEEEKLIKYTNDLVVGLDKDRMIEVRREMKIAIKDCQSFVKAANIILDFFYGSGKCDRGNKFPSELDQYFQMILGKL